MELVPYAAWQAKLALHGYSDQIKVQNLQMTANAGVDAWGREKLQPILLSVTLYLERPFEPAAEADSLDASTVHYGHLSKNIRSVLQAIDKPLETHNLADLVAQRVEDTSGKTRLRATEIDIKYPKGSLMGDAAGYTLSLYTSSGRLSKIDTYSNVLYLENVRIPCIIGINSNERQQKQPVVVNLWINCVPPGASNAYTEVELVLVNAISESSFETLESLSTTVVQKLREKFYGNKDQGYGTLIRLRVEKPLAVPFADAPSIEIVRPVKV